LSTADSSDIEEKVRPVFTPNLLINWALKTKLRVVSKEPLNWCVQLKSTEEANGIKHFTEDPPEREFVSYTYVI